jgi:hypothetical protein
MEVAMRRLVYLMLLLPVSINSASAAEVERFEKGKHVWTVVHQPGGLTIESVEQNTSAVDVSAAGFFALKTIDGQKLIHGVGWHMMYGQEVIDDCQNRWVIASYPDGNFRICPSREIAMMYGRPSFGVDAMKIPPKPGRKVWRQFWATKGNFFFRVKMKGDRWDCVRFAKAWGFETMAHTDGGSSLAPGIKTPSIAKVYNWDTYHATALSQPNSLLGLLN